jgi:hypothetical protein
MNKIVLSEQEKNIIEMLDNKLYTVEFIEHWINRDDNIAVNAPSALQAMGAKGYYTAVQQIVSYMDKKGIRLINIDPASAGTFNPFEIEQGTDSD